MRKSLMGGFGVVGERLFGIVVLGTKIVNGGRLKFMSILQGIPLHGVGEFKYMLSTL